MLAPRKPNSEKINMKIEKIVDLGKHYLVDNTALLLGSTPIYTAMETLASGMSVATSFESRLKVAALAYMGLGTFYVKGRDLSKKILGFTEKTKGWKHVVHDSIYNLAWNIPFSIVIYQTSGADLEQTVKGVAGASILSFVSGPINGHSIDAFRDFTGTIPSPRKMPKIIKNSKKSVKKLLAAGMVAGSLISTLGIYAIKEEFFPDKVYQEYQEKVEKTKVPFPTKISGLEIEVLH